ESSCQPGTPIFACSSEGSKRGGPRGRVPRRGPGTYRSDGALVGQPRGANRRVASAPAGAGGVARPGVWAADPSLGTGPASDRGGGGRFARRAVRGYTSGVRTAPQHARASATAIDAAGRGRVVIEAVEPEIDCGRFPIKRVVG